MSRTTLGKKKSAGESPRLDLKIPRDMLADIEKFCELLELSRSDLARKALSEFLVREKKKL